MKSSSFLLSSSPCMQPFFCLFTWFFLKLKELTCKSEQKTNVISQVPILGDLQP